VSWIIVPHAATRLILTLLHSTACLPRPHAKFSQPALTSAALDTKMPHDCTITASARAAHCTGSSYFDALQLISHFDSGITPLGHRTAARILPHHVYSAARTAGATNSTPTSQSGVFTLRRQLDDLPDISGCISRHSHEALLIIFAE